MKIIFLFLIGIGILSCKPTATKNENLLVSADSLVKNLEQFKGQKIRLEGKVLHICPVDGKKMKLLCDNKKVVKVVPSDTATTFNWDWNGKQISVEGIAHETRIPRSYVDSLAKTVTLLCHIDESPCSDTTWRNNMHRAGKAEASARRSIEYLNKVMEENGTDYVSIIILVADTVKGMENMTEKGIKKE